MRSAIIFNIFLVLLCFGCNSEFHSVENKKSITVFATSSHYKNDWLKKDSIAYGLIVYENNGKPVFGKPVPCKILEISKRGVKCIALEKVTLFDQFNCYKIGIEKDEIWYDLPQDFFKTNKEAEQFLSENNLILTFHKKNKQ